jgi:hypothetical protein
MRLNIICIFLSILELLNAFRSTFRRIQHIVLRNSKGSNEHLNFRNLDTTKAIFQSIKQNGPSSVAGGAGASTSFEGLLALNKVWCDLKNGSWKIPPKQIVFDYTSSNPTTTTPTTKTTNIPATHQYDVIICGGTLGIFYATALQKRGFRVAVIERSKIQGRTQEWNISKKELQILFELEILPSNQQTSLLEEIIGIEFNPIRIGFSQSSSSSTSTNNATAAATSATEKKSFEIWTKNILNLGVKPDRLIELVKEEFMKYNGSVYEETMVQSVEVYDQTVLVSLQQQQQSKLQLQGRLLIDGLGGQSPIMRQYRGAVPPDGMCIVVGSLARGYQQQQQQQQVQENEASSITGWGDLLFANDPIIETAPVLSNNEYNLSSTSSSSSSSSSTVPPSSSKIPIQYFWEAFPASSHPTDRTTYLFTYMDLSVYRPSLLHIMEDYWELLLDYQQTFLPNYHNSKKNDLIASTKTNAEQILEHLQIQRILYGLFPVYRASPFQPSVDRILCIGDASGLQSPLSFGGFASLTRHLPRMIPRLEEALTENYLSYNHILALQANSYYPNLRAAWMFQKAMMAPIQVTNEDAANTAMSSEETSNSLPSSTNIPKLSRPFPNTVVLATLSNSFSSMQRLGDKIMQPFLQDILQFSGLIQTLGLAFLQDPLTPVKIIPYVGIQEIGVFLYHLVNMGWYTWCHCHLAPILSRLLLGDNSSLLSKEQQFYLKCRLDAWKYGSGLDYEDDELV